MELTFTLDMVPAAPEPHKIIPCLFETAAEMYEFNRQSYEEAAALPDEAREKIRAVVHFRGPRVFRVWRKIVFEDGLAAKFSHFSTGGLANSSGVKKLPVIPFSIPLVPVAAYMKAQGRTQFDFHVLGQARPVDIISMSLIEEHVRAVHGVNVHFTHDATTPIKEAAFGQKMMLVDERTLTVRSATLDRDSSHLYFDDGRSAVDAFYDLINYDLAPYGIGPFDSENHLFRTEAGGDLSVLAYTLMTLNGIYNRTKLWRWASGITRACYPIYQSGDKAQFEARLVDIVGNVIHWERRSSAVRQYAKALAATLDLLTGLDVDYADSLVCTRLIAEEHPLLKGYM
jgi:hypothetical protein